MPEITVWPVSSSVRTRKVGSSSESFCSAMPILSWSILVFGSMATEMTGSGKLIDSSTSWCCSVERVSPVMVLRRPMAAAMSPVRTSSISSRWLACIWRMRPTRSRSSRTGL